MSYRQDFQVVDDIHGFGAFLMKPQVKFRRRPREDNTDESGRKVKRLKSNASCCVRCEDIRAFIYSRVPRYATLTYNIGQIITVRERGCALCNEFIVGRLSHAMSKEGNCALEKYSSEISATGEEGSTTGPGPVTSMNHLEIRWEHPDGDGGVQKLALLRGPLPDHVDTVPIACRVDHLWMNIPALRAKMDRCSTEHGNACTWPSIPTFLGRPSWLIDVDEMCIVRSSPEMHYLALSYVWGGTPFLQLNKSNIDGLQMRGAFSKTGSVDCLPNTVKDAIQLVKLLGERYLWADCVCIVQDDEEAKHNELNTMASIYANAHVTIIAANGEDAYDGLPGVPGVSKPRSFPQEVVYKSGDDIEMVEISKPSVFHSRWNTRGWTWQEGLFSRRKIVFSGGTVWWQCSEIWHEDRYLPEIMDSAYERLKVAFIQRRFPDLYEFEALVRVYNFRRLSYPEDSLRAFAGMTAALSHVYEDGFLGGLPELFFDLALLWRPDNTMKRRKASVPEKDHMLPSWSWAGWQGIIEHGCWPLDMTVNEHSVRPSSMRIVGGVEWYCSEHIGGTRRRLEGPRRLRNYVLDAHLYDKPLPSGWQPGPPLRLQQITSTPNRDKHSPTDIDERNLTKDDHDSTGADLHGSADDENSLAEVENHILERVDDINDANTCNHDSAEYCCTTAQYHHWSTEKHNCSKEHHHCPTEHHHGPADGYNCSEEATHSLEARDRRMSYLWDKPIRRSYFHEQFPNRTFFFPIPVTNMESTVLLRPLEPYLFCRTTRAFVHLSAIEEHLNFEPRYLGTLRTENGTWAGILHLSGDEVIPVLIGGLQHLGSRTKGTPIPNSWDPLELIWISEGCAFNGMAKDPYFYEWDHPERPRKGYLYMFVNVMWIEWKDGVAYRKGVGRVLKDIWENKLRLEEIDVVLN